MLYVFSSHCYCHPVIYSLSLFIIYSVNSFIANVICYITIPSLNKVLYLVSCSITLLEIKCDVTLSLDVAGSVGPWKHHPRGVLAAYGSPGLPLRYSCINSKSE